MTTRARGVPLFLAIAFGFSWAVAAVGWASGLMRTPGGFAATLVVFMLGPSIAAVACAFLYDKGRRARALGFRNNPFNVWLIPALLIPAVIAAAGTALTLALSDQTFVPPADAVGAQLAAAGASPEDLPVPIWALVAIQLPIGLAINWFYLLISEELGWRGWLYDRWAGLGFWRCAGLTGVVWGAWHAPIIVAGYNYPGMPVAGPLAMIGFTVLLSPAIHLVRERGGNVAHAALFHGAFNGFAPLSLMLLSAPAFPWSGVMGIGGATTMIVTAVLIALYRRARPATEAQAAFS